MPKTDLFTNEQIAGPLDPDPQTGWVRREVWRYDGAGGMWGDDAVIGFTAYYDKPGTPHEGEISYYVRATKTYNQPEVRDTHVIDCQVVYRNRETREEDYDYPDGDVFFHDNFQRAVEKARRYALRNESHTWLV